MHTVVMPKLGDTMEEGKILSWLKNEGDAVARGDALAEIETEKVTIPVEAFAAGVLRKILVPAGQTVPVGAAIAYTGAASEPLPGSAGATQASAPATNLAHAQGQANASPEIVARPTVAQPAAATAAQASSAALRVASPTENGYSPNGHNGNGHGASNGSSASSGIATDRLFISPIARRIANERQVDVSRIHGSGPGGRIIRQDVEDALDRQETGEQPAIKLGVVTPTPAPVAADEAEAVALSQMRKTIARRLQQSMQSAPHFYVTVSVDATRLGEFRVAVNEYASTLANPIKVSVNDLIIKGVATALTHQPEVNASFDGERLLFKKHVNIGVAVALEQGLIVPVIHDADKRGVLDIARESRRLTDAARSNKLKAEDFQGGTFSVSNLGMYGVEEFTAIINPPEAAILAVGAIVPTPIVRDGQIIVRDMMKVTLSVDHRILDGVAAARYLQELKRLLEQPMAMLI